MVGSWAYNVVESLSESSEVFQLWLRGGVRGFTLFNIVQILSESFRCWNGGLKGGRRVSCLHTIQFEFINFDTKSSLVALYLQRGSSVTFRCFRIVFFLLVLCGLYWFRLRATARIAATIQY